MHIEVTVTVCSGFAPSTCGMRCIWYNVEYGTTIEVVNTSYQYECDDTDKQKNIVINAISMFYILKLPFIVCITNEGLPGAGEQNTFDTLQAPKRCPRAVPCWLFVSKFVTAELV